MKHTEERVKSFSFHDISKLLENPSENVCPKMFHNKKEYEQQVKQEAALKIQENLEYSEERDQSKLFRFFDRLINQASKNSVCEKLRKSLYYASKPSDERKLIDLTTRVLSNSVANPDNIVLTQPFNLKQFLELKNSFENGKILDICSLIEILLEARNVLRKFANIRLLHLNKFQRVIIVGDLHGQLKDLVCILTQFGVPDPNNCYVFNGDFVDRGPNSVEVLALLAFMQILYPKSVFLNRGNHEDSIVASRHGFLQECRKKYKSETDSLWEVIKDFFAWIPFATVVKSKFLNTFIIHGGLSTSTSIEAISQISRHKFASFLMVPWKDKDVYEHMRAVDLLWSDPVNTPGIHFNSMRQLGKFFGPDVTMQFLKKYGFTMIIRSHQVKPHGFDYTHNKRLITLFSASNYCNCIQNHGAVALLSNEYPLKFWKFIAPQLNMKPSKPVHQSENEAFSKLINIIQVNEVELRKSFQQADRSATGRIPFHTWKSIMERVLHMHVPWDIIYKYVVREDHNGIIYDSVFEKVPSSHLKDVNKRTFEKSAEDRNLVTLFNLIDSDHSGFISNSEFAQICKLMQESGQTLYSDQEIAELISIFDTDKTGKIDLEEFSAGFQRAKLYIKKT